MRRRAVAALLLLVVVAAVAGTSARGARVGTVLPIECRSAQAPLGALPPAVPAWCTAAAPTTDTAVHAANAWLDGFAGGAAHAPLARSYRVFENARRAATAADTTVYRTQHFAHNGHWMVDIAGHGTPSGVYEGSAVDFFTGPNNGGALMRPDTEFRFEEDRLVVEFDASAGMSVYGDRVWPEIVVTTAPKPAGRETNGWYAAGLFGGHPAIGCAFPADGLSECRIYDEERITANLNAHSRAGAALAFGGSPDTETLRRAWRVCGPTDPDAACRDRFRVELTRDAVIIFVNGVRYMEHSGLPATARLPEKLLRSPVYVYFASWTYLIEASVARVHWGRVAINPPPQLMR